MHPLKIILLSILLPVLSISGISAQESGMTYVRNGTLDRILIDGGYIKDGKYHFFVTDHLGSVRAVMDEDGKVAHTVHYYPFGEEFDSEDGAGLADSAAQPYRFNAKEDQSFTGVPLLDYGARFYNPTLARWTTMDPLAEKYYSISPYAFCNNNPVRFIDFDGMDIYHINSSGVITFSEENTEIHRLYLVKEDGERSDNYITLSNSDAMSALKQKDPDNKNEISSYTSDSNINDMFNIFLFAADNTTVEWALHRGQDNSYTIGTLHDEESSGNWADYGIQKPIASVHSHPEVSTEYTAEVESMGYWYNGALPAGDWENVIRDVNLHGYQTRMNYVYFPNSTRLYHIEYKSVSYIRKISNYKNFYFGTFNHK